MATTQVMSYLAFVCLSVHLFATAYKHYQLYLYEILPEMYLWTRKNGLILEIIHVWIRI